MKRIFSSVLCALLAVIFTTAFAQQNIFIWKNGGNISVKSATNIDSITTSVGSWLFDIRTSAATSVTTNTLEASVNVSFADKVPPLSQTPEVGVCFSTSATPTYAGERKRLGSSVSSYNFTLYDLDSGTIYYYRAYIKLGDEVFYGNVKSIMTFGEKPTIPYTLINGHKFVDLGLPSGLLWARTNVGAASSSDDGDYFAWGEKKPKSRYAWNTYMWYMWSGASSKYNSSDGKTTLDSVDDAASVNWGAPCRMPSSSEFSELYDQCDWSWKSNYNGTSGYLVTGPSGNTIFFSASGYRDYDDLDNHGSYGYYWSRSLVSDYTDFACNLNFYGGVSPTSDGSHRYYGFTVRPVAEK